MAERWLKYTCPTCHRAFAQPDHYRAHLVTPHFPCPLNCGLSFVRPQAHLLRWHRARMTKNGVVGVVPSTMVGRPDGYMVALPTIVRELKYEGVP